MTGSWDVAFTSDIIRTHLEGCDAIVTFDGHGVSGHSNHISCFSAVKRISSDTDVECYALQSFSRAFKYSGWLTFVFDRLLLNPKCDIIYILSPLDVMNHVFGAMQQHKSQLVWFRYLYLAFSRYIIINTLRRI